jgi:hypothetical protein
MDWKQFLRQHNIDYVTVGPNVIHGHISIKCVWCGPSDPSEHLCINLQGHGYHCFRNRAHSGRDLTRLVQALIGCSFDQARIIVHGTTHIPDNFLSQVHGILAPIAPQLHSSTILKLPSKFLPIKDLPSARPYIKHLTDPIKDDGRGYSIKQVMRFTERYGLRYCTRGAFKGRIIFPIEHERKLVSWIGRTVYKGVKQRYKNLSTDPKQAERDNMPVAIRSTGHCLLWFDDLTKADVDTIFLCEGPFDALRINVLGRAHGLCATCFFTNTPSQQQVNLLHELFPHFKNRYLLLDQGTFPLALRIKSQLSNLHIVIKHLPFDVKDPGLLLNEDQLLKICS